VSDRQRNWLLCGGIGSGKSAVRRILQDHGVSTIDADSVGHEVLEPGGAAVEAVAEAWPEVVEVGVVDRKKLGAVVFNDSASLQRLEAMTHTHTFALIGERIEEFIPPVVVEIPLLINPFAGSWRRMVVDAPDHTRVERSVSRGMDRDDVFARMASQPSRQEWLAAADLVIPNHGDLIDLNDTVASLLPLLSEAPGSGQSVDAWR
jgi:dephospho-CoA kinase